MKIIPLHTDEKQLIKRAIKRDRVAQQIIYDQHASKMLSVCRMYIKDLHFAEDAMLKGFSNVFKYLESFRFDGSFEGWIRRIMVREALAFLKAKKQLDFTGQMDEIQSVTYDLSIENLEVTPLQELIDELPSGYKTVFIMYVVEGYKHHEIAAILDITEGTSKSQLSKAKDTIRKKLKEQEDYGMGK